MRIVSSLRAALCGTAFPCVASTQPCRISFQGIRMRQLLGACRRRRLCKNNEQCREEPEQHKQRQHHADPTVNFKQKTFHILMLIFAWCTAWNQRNQPVGL